MRLGEGPKRRSEQRGARAKIDPSPRLGYMDGRSPPFRSWYSTLYPCSGCSHCGSCQLTFRDVGPRAENTRRLGVMPVVERETGDKKEGWSVHTRPLGGSSWHPLGPLIHLPPSSRPPTLHSRGGLGTSKGE